MKAIRVTSPYFCAGIDFSRGNAAPIIKYMKYWTEDRIKQYCLKKGWDLEIYDE